MRSWLGLVLVAAALTASAQAADPFGVAASLQRQEGAPVIEVAFTVPPGHHLYADTLSVRLLPGGQPLLPATITTPAHYQDAFSDAPRDSYTNDFRAVYRAAGLDTRADAIEVRYQGCSESVCFFPAVRQVPLGRTSTSPGSDTEHGIRGGGSGPVAASGFQVAGRTVGYLRPAEFLAFLDRLEGRSDASVARSGWRSRMLNLLRLFSADPVEFFRQYGVWWTLLAILLGGVLLNLTPCVLPMIPVNLAIIGAGAQGSSRWRGLALGGAYGIGMALVYGILGVVVVLTGATFGALNASPWFNLLIAVLFVVLGLAMFDVITIDFSRFQRLPGAGTGASRGRFVSALGMGGVAALLAGACVAPVVIAVLVLASQLFAQGARAIGLALPFILGCGMALPWPLAGGGLARLPKPGAWMEKVKIVFGIFILALAAYYGYLAYRGWAGSIQPRTDETGISRMSADQGAEWDRIVVEARRAGRPLFIDFWATWCKNCEAMEATTFRDAEVRRRLSAYTLIKIQAEDPASPRTKRFLDSFGVKGLPTYVVMRPDTGNGEHHE